MNPNLSRLGTQLRDIWKQLGASQRVSVVLATLALFGSVLGLAYWSSRVDYKLLYGKLPEGESARVIAALDDLKIPYRLGAGGSSVMVPADKVYQARVQLAGKNLPRGDGVGFEIFDRPNFGLSDFVQRANYVRAIQGELARTLGQFEEVETARVMIVMPENRLLLDKDKHPTASVFVRGRSSSALPPATVNAMRFLVANAVEGLKPNFVSIVDSMGNSLSENVEDDSMVGLTTTQLSARRNYEQYLAKKVEGMLDRVLGPGQAIVRVAAEINFDTITRTEEKYDPDGQVIKSQTKNDENTDSSTAHSQGAVGVTVNTGVETNSAAGPLNTTKNRKTTGNVEYDNSRSTSNILQAAGGLKRLSAAVTVAKRFEGTGTARKAVSREPAEIEKLKRIVQNALGIQVGGDPARTGEVVLEELAFNDQVTQEITQNLEAERKRELWMSIGRSLLYPGLAIGVLVFFVRLVKRTPVEQIPIGIPIGRLSAAGNGNGNGNGNGHGNGHGVLSKDWKREGNAGVVTADVLNQLIKENPDNVTQAIRTWLTRGTPPPA